MSTIQYVAIVYFVVWSILFFYLLSLNHREHELHRDVKQMMRTLEDGQPSAVDPGQDKGAVIDAAEASTTGTV